MNKVFFQTDFFIYTYIAYRFKFCSITDRVVIVNVPDQFSGLRRIVPGIQQALERLEQGDLTQVDLVQLQEQLVAEIIHSDRYVASVVLPKCDTIRSIDAAFYLHTQRRLQIP